MLLILGLAKDMSVARFATFDTLFTSLIFCPEINEGDAILW